MTTRRHPRPKRRGNILVLSAFLMIGMLAMLAFAIDVGYLCLARDELQRSADAAAIAAAWELIDEAALTGNANELVVESNARASASQFGGLNHVLRSVPNVSHQDVTVGYLQDPANPREQLDESGANLPNAVQVRVRRTADQNGEVPFFIARVLGIDSVATEATATAALITSVRGFRSPSDGSNVDLLPFTLDRETWSGLAQRSGNDDWKWDPDSRQVRRGQDGILEVNLYPHGDGPPGNRGTVDIGSSGNSTSDIARQILDGVSPQDLEYHGGKLELDGNGELGLNGDTGISAGVKDELQSIIGQRRTVPIFSRVQGPGNNAQYTITGFVGVRIMEVRLTGADTSKRVIIQPAIVKAKGTIPSSERSTSEFVYSPVWLIR